MLKKIGIGLVVVVVAFVVVVATRPDTFTVERSTTITSSPEVAFALVNDFRKWAEWSPWEKLDPTMKKTFDAVSSGPGAGYGWAGNDKVGEGRMNIESTKPNQEIAIRLEFIKPWQAVNQTHFTFAQTGSTTKVTWTLNGNANFFMKAMSLFKSSDDMIGPDFEKGLSQLKVISETEAKRQLEEAQRLAAEAAKAAAAAATAAATPPPVTPAHKK